MKKNSHDDVRTILFDCKAPTEKETRNIRKF